ncbi:hypothetical protein HNP84_000477 [Thermocatellispora tengchongensis]|uniref:Uncharacterized protein n=1 Tax=Thermocatellispora tengchongensis TaxID=1073253 RepID=A0A840NVF3_9ACTN|nr:hypothetical protein [Thermocatellispora tengchongensis]MBB5130789.1 hypothetical protein [Thermocatellispora tengchongensis]
MSPGLLAMPRPRAVPLSCQEALYLHLISGTWPGWIITPGPMWWAVRLDPLPPRQRAAGLRNIIGRPGAVELVMELRTEDRTARRAAAAL